MRSATWAKLLAASSVVLACTCGKQPEGNAPPRARERNAPSSDPEATNGGMGSDNGHSETTQAAGPDLGFAVLLPTTPVFRDAQGTAAVMTNALNQPVSPPTIAGHPAGFVVRVVGRNGARVRVRNIPGTAHGCGNTLSGLDWAEVDLWVDEESLAAVLAAETTFEFEDDTRATVVAGVPVYEEDGRWVVDAWGSRVALDEPPEALVRVFGDRKSFDRDGARGRLAHDAAIAVNGRQVSGFSFHSDADGKLEFGGSADAPVVRTHCLELTAKIDANAEMDTGVIGFGSGGGFGGGDPQRGVDRLEAGAELRWADGSIAGTAVADHVLAGVFTPGQGGDRCYRVSVGGGGSHLQLCPAKADAEQLPWADVRITNAAGSAGLDAKSARRLAALLTDTLRNECFAGAIHREPALDGEVNVALELTEDSSVASVSVDDAGLGDEDAIECAKRTIARAPRAAVPPDLGPGKAEVTLRVSGR